MSITAIMTFIGSLVMLGAWALVRRRSEKSPGGASTQIRLLQSFFLFMGLFCLCIFTPQMVLSVNAAKFPIFMAWGYTISHCFLYVALISMLCLTFSMIPRLADKQKYAIIFGGIAAAAMTVLTIVTMVAGTQPEYDFEKYVTLFNVAPLLGALIGIFATVSVFPAALLIIINGIHNPSSRSRSFLLGAGLLLIMTAGPLHDIAKTWQLYMVADIVSIIGFVLLSSGIMYRFEERITVTSNRGQESR